MVAAIVMGKKTTKEKMMTSQYSEFLECFKIGMDAKQAYAASEEKLIEMFGDDQKALRRFVKDIVRSFTCPFRNIKIVRQVASKRLADKVALVWIQF